MCRRRSWCWWQNTRHGKLLISTLDSRSALVIMMMIMPIGIRRRWRHERIIVVWRRGSRNGGTARDGAECTWRIDLAE
jgi:hypothetical protein